MIPGNLDWAFQEKRVVRTLYAGGPGETTIRRLADLVLPTGKILIGYPGNGYDNEAGDFRPVVSPGRYPVFASVVTHHDGHKTVAFVTVRFEPKMPCGWEEGGTFFTDDGTGCLLDESRIELLTGEQSRISMSWKQWNELKEGVFNDGECSLLLDSETGANAIVFKTFDYRYHFFIGKDELGKTACLVIDCRYDPPQPNATMPQGRTGQPVRHANKPWWRFW